MRTNTRVVLKRLRPFGDEKYIVCEVVGSLTPKVNSTLSAQEVQKLIDEHSGIFPVYTVVIRGAK